jgi:hypothetical protein
MIFGWVMAIELVFFVQILSCPDKNSLLECSNRYIVCYSLYHFWGMRGQKHHFLLAHLTQRVRWAIAITWRPSSSVVRRKLFQKSSPLKVLVQWKPNLVWIITRVSSFKIVSGDAVHQPTWPLLLKIEHIVKLQVLGNNSKTVNNIKNLTGIKMISTSRSTYPAILK